MRDVFEYFEGGKEGVKRRFMERIQAGLKKIESDSALGSTMLQSILETHLGLESGTVRRLASGDTQALNCRVIEGLAAPLDLKLENAFGSFVNLTPEDEQEWAQVAESEDFVPVGGAGTLTCMSDQRVRLFMLLRALRELQ